MPWSYSREDRLIFRVSLCFLLLETEWGFQKKFRFGMDWIGFGEVTDGFHLRARWKDIVVS